MLFIIKSKEYLSDEQLYTSALINAYHTIRNFPMKATELLLDSYIQTEYKIGLKNLCIKLLLSTTFYKDNNGDFIIIFKNKEDDLLARLITYGNGAISGSNILKTALNG